MRSFLAFAVFALLGCSGFRTEAPAPPPALASAAGKSAPEAPQAPPVLLFTIGMHIEPFGASTSPLVPDADAPPERQGRRPNYNNLRFFEAHVRDIDTVTRMVEAHGGRMTIQAQTPFTTVTVQTGNRILAEVAARGHEIGLHFHEDAHLGKASQSLPVETWCAVMKEEIGYLKNASGTKNIRYWSGGNTYPHLYEAAACAGLTVNSDWKNHKIQETPMELLGVNPWRPAGGTDGVDLSSFKTNNPHGPIIFLPEGVYTSGRSGAQERVVEAGGEDAYFDNLRQSIDLSLAAAKPGQANVAHFTLHAGEFRGNDPAHPFAALERFLTQVIDPKVAAGQMKWATFGQMADAYQSSTVLPPATPPAPAAAATPVPATAGYITFAVNVHDWTHPSESADTLLQLIDIFEKAGVRGDFYFTPEITRKYAELRPDVIARMKASHMTVSYHVRPPHPAYAGFDGRLKGLSENLLYQTLKDFETYRLDPATAELDRSQPGGYTYVASVFGTNPVVVPVLNSADVKGVALRVYRDLGAKMTLMYHGEGAKIDRPYEYVEGLLVRPSDFSLGRVSTAKDANFWWNEVAKPNGEAYNPTRLLKAQLAEWSTHGYPRPPFITSLIHENNYRRSGPEGWTPFYYNGSKKNENSERLPPYDLTAPDPSRERSAAEQKLILDDFAEMVNWAAKNLTVVTSDDIVTMAAHATNETQK